MFYDSDEPRYFQTMRFNVYGQYFFKLSISFQNFFVIHGLKTKAAHTYLYLLRCCLVHVIVRTRI